MDFDYTFWVPTAVFCVIAFIVGLAFSGWLEHNHKRHWKEWEIKFPLKPLYIGIALVIFVPLVILFSNLLSDVAGISTNKMTNPDQVRTLAIAFVGTISGIGALFGVYLAILRSEENKRQNDTAEQGLITDRINKAVESLGKLDRENKPLLEVRLGALHALERIAQDSLRDHIRIMKIICSYIRINRPFNNKMAETEAITDDIREALHIIGHRDKWTEDERHLNKEKKENYKLDLRHCDLHNLELFDADLSNALLDGSTLREAILVRVKFKSAHFFETNISDADIEGADMTDVTTVKAYAHRGDFSDCLTFTQPQIDKMFLGKGVKLAKNVKIDEDLFHPQKGTTYYKKYNTFKNFMEARHEWLEESEN